MKNTIQTKRTTPAKNGFRKLHARTSARKRKLRATTAMADPHVDLESDVPNVGIGRALIVILVLHVIAIAAIYAHSTFFGASASDATADSGKPTSSPVGDPGAAAAALVAPAAESDDDYSSGRYIVVTGDTYIRIAYGRNVDPTALRALNDNRPLRAGVVLDLPAELSSRPVAVRETPTTRAPQSVAVAEEVFETPHARAIVIDEDPAPRQPAKAAVAAASTMPDSGKRYTVKSGDTVWRIAHNNKVTSDQLLKINGIKDASKLKIGRVLIIPSK